MMTLHLNIKDLIHELQKYDPDLDVVIAIYKHPTEIGDDQFDAYPNRVREITTDEGDKFIRIVAYEY
jgi:hypothetical protein